MEFSKNKCTDKMLVCCKTFGKDASFAAIVKPDTITCIYNVNEIMTIQCFDVIVIVLFKRSYWEFW